MTTHTPRSENPATSCCDEFAAMSRRGLFGGGLAAAGAMAGATVFGSAVVAAFGAPASAAVEADSVLVVLSMRGAADGLSLVVPYNDPVYYAARPRIAVPKATLLATNGTFGMHPQLAPLMPLWNSGRIAAIHSTGLPAPNRSHFSAMEELEDADPGSAQRQGWLNRLLGVVPGSSPLQGFNLGGGVLPTSVTGTEQVMAGASVKSVNFSGADQWDDGSRMKSLHRMWDGASGALGVGMRSAFNAVQEFRPVQSQPSNAAQYPKTDLGKAMSEVARVIRGNIGTSVITVDQGDWDMHSDLGTLDRGRMVNNAGDLAKSIAAFFNDLGTQGSKVTLVALSEFGRRVQENASRGLDHGYGTVMFVAGAGVKGGKYYGTIEPLVNDIDADVKVTTDYRSVLSEVVTTRFGASRATVFPNFTPENVGVMSGL